MNTSRKFSPGSLITKFVLLTTLTFASAFSFGQDDFFGAIDVDLDSTDRANNSNYSLIGWLTENISYGLEEPGAGFSRQESELTKVETSLFAQLDAPIGKDGNFRFSGKIYHDAIYSLNDDTNYTEQERNEFRNRFEIKDLYIERQFENGFYLKAGNQLFSWGLAEYLRVTDVINTEDQFTFGQQDLEDLRLQVPAVLLSYSSRDWVFDAVMTYDAGRNDTAPARDEFDQLINFRDSEFLIDRKDPQDDYEFFLRASTHYSNGDIQIVAGDYNDNALTVDAIEGLGSINPLILYSQNRMQALGVAANWAKDSWLLFGEIGMHFDKAVQANAGSFLRQVNGWDEKDQLLSVAGIEYNGFRNIILTLEADNVHTRDHDQHMQAQEDQTSYGARAYWTALNDRLEFIAVWNDLVDNSSQIGRFSVDYDYSDNLSFGLLFVYYQSDEDSVFYDYRQNDVVQVQLQYNFQH